MLNHWIIKQSWEGSGLLQSIIFFQPIQPCHNRKPCLQELGFEATGVVSNTRKLDNDAEMSSVDTAGVEDLMDAVEEVKPCWTKPSPSK
jgi:hypothetical protein